MPRFESVAPVLPVRDVPSALDRFARLGFETSAYEDGAEYGYVRRGEVWLHVAHAGDHHDPLTTASSVYLYVDDADAVHEEWTSSGVDGRHHAPEDTDYGLREGAYVDPDGNLLKYGSFLRGSAG